MKAVMQFFITLILSLVLLMTISLGIPQPVAAFIQQQEEAPGQLLYQSRHSLRDETGSTWQVVLFEHIKGGKVETIDLRLVGFPGNAVFTHPNTLKIVANSQKVWESPDKFYQQAPAPNVGQYDLKKILSQLPTNGRVRLILPLEVERVLFVPSPVLLEWQLLAQS